jgi:hypothetical protein
MKNIRKNNRLSLMNRIVEAVLIAVFLVWAELAVGPFGTLFVGT